MFWFFIRIMMGIGFISDGGAGIVIGIILILSSVGPVLHRFFNPEPGMGAYAPPRDSGIDQFMKLLKAAAWVLKTVAKVEGKGSPEWSRAKEALMALGEGFLTSVKAEELLSQSTERDFTQRYFPQENRLVLLRIAIDVAYADGKVTEEEKRELEKLAVKLGVDPNMVQVILNLLKGDAGSHTADLRDAYSVLGVEPGAQVGEIRGAYKKLMFENHPDRAEPENREQATRKSAEINAAYNILMGQFDKADEYKQKSSNPPPGPKPKPPPRPKPKPPPKPKTEPPPKKEKPTLCGACERKVAPKAKFCGYCGTRV